MNMLLNRKEWDTSFGVYLIFEIYYITYVEVYLLFHLDLNRAFYPLRFWFNSLCWPGDELYLLYTQWLSITIYRHSILPYIHNPRPTIIAKMIIPTIKDATTFMRNTTIAIITINAITPTIIDPIVPAKPKQIRRG